MTMDRRDLGSETRGATVLRNAIPQNSVPIPATPWHVVPPALHVSVATPAIAPTSPLAPGTQVDGFVLA
jgi:hypothetical protein